MPYATARDDTRLYWKEVGSGRPVVLIHGWPLNGDSWDDIAVALAEAGFRAIAYDRRGFGRSDQPAAGYDYDTFADDLATVIDAAKAEGAAIVGFSMGGGEVARYLAKNGTAKVSAAVLISSIFPYMLKTGDNPDGVDQSVFDGMAQGIKEDRSGFMQDFAKNFYGVGLLDKPVSQGVLDAFFLMAMMAGLSPTLGAAKAFASTDFRGDARSFDLPTLILHGTGDKIVPIDVSARQAAKLVPRARLIEYSGAPHGTLATNKDDVIRDLVDFLQGAQVGRPQESDALQPAL